MSKNNHPPRSMDFEFSWVTRELGPQWEAWRAYAAGWLTTQHAGPSERIRSIRTFFQNYLCALNFPADPSWLLRRSNNVPDFFDAVCSNSSHGIDLNNHIHAFLTWVLENHFSEPDDRGRPMVLPTCHNPVSKRSKRGIVRRQESVHSPLPYRFIRELNEILAPENNFRDWRWAQAAIEVTGTVGRFGDWFEIAEKNIDATDPDCVWRWRKTARRPSGIMEIWCPARAVALLVKLTLPLRTYQVRMLDSGDADTWRYTSNGWTRNRGPLASGDERRPVQRGVFRRIKDRESASILTGFYINTNKTADICPEGGQAGYVIPWQHDRLLYWLEKLRNWQDKYNPVEKATSWNELELRHLGHSKSANQLARMPDTCFLFRNAAAHGDERAKPLTSHFIETLWCKLLGELEQRCAARGETLADGKPLQFLVSKRGEVTHFPLHSLRVSLLTCLALDAEVPLVVLSKLVAGHSRLVMTLYYTKVGISRMTQMLNVASEKLESNAADGFQRFLAEASYDQLSSRSVFNSLDGVKIALVERSAERNPVGWMPRHHGMCLVGGNTSPTEGNSRIGGCYNGGPRLRSHGNRPDSDLYAPVPGGAGNCVRCRWFVTEPRYIDALRAHFNNVSYHLAEAAKEAKAHEDSLDKLKARRYAAEQAQAVFPEEADYLKTERLWESFLAKVDQLANDLTATYRLIRRCMAIIDRDRDNAKSAQQLVAVGGLHDLRMAFEDTQSELLQLAGVCLDAELYPDESPGKAVVRRSQFLDSALYREGVQPIFLTLSEDQQLRLGNRFMNHLAATANPSDLALGLRRVVDTIEAGYSLTEIGVVDDMIDMLETELRAPLMRISDIAQVPRKRRIPELVK